MNKIHWNLIKILVADDDPGILHFFSKIIRKLGCMGCCVSNGKEALEMLESYRFDLCFLDIFMVEMGGIEATIAIREQYDKFLPIVGMSASVTDDVRKKCLKIGMNMVVSKPVSAENVKEFVVRYVFKEVEKESAL